MIVMVIEKDDVKEDGFFVNKENKKWEPQMGLD